MTLVIEYFTHGSIESYVLKEKPGPKACVSFCTDMGNAIEYLHSRMPSIVIHRDIKPANFLLTNSLRVKLGDFGIARAKRTEQQQQGGVSANLSSCSLESMAIGEQQPQDELTSNCGTVRFMAPEVASTDGAKKTTKYSAKADIFSLGMVFYFVWERMLPGIEGHRTPATHFSAIYSGRRPNFHKTPKSVRDIVSTMWRLDPADRPDASYVVDYLNNLRCKNNIVNVNVVLSSRHSESAAARLQTHHHPEFARRHTSTA